METPHTPLKILFLCTAHNSLSQRLSLVLQERSHHVTVELAISSKIMIEAAKLARPDLIICPFLTKKVPAEVFESYLTWIIHPGPPGDAGPSALDWALLGDDGSEPDSQKALELISTNEYVATGKGRTHWGVTVLQAIEEFDAGPVWAWDQFPLILDGPGALTKASLYRGPVTKAAVTACLCAIDRLLSVAAAPSFPAIHPGLSIDPLWSIKSVTTQKEFPGCKTRTRPLLKPTQRAWNPKTDSAALVSRRLRASDSQPGVQSTILYGRNLYLYGGLIEMNPIPFEGSQPGEIVAQRNGAVLVSTADGLGVWITHVRRLKPKNQTLLPPKLPAILGLKSVPDLSSEVDLDAIPTWDLVGFARVPGTFQEVWIEYENVYGAFKIAYLFSNFYNGAASTSQCQQLLSAIKEVTCNSDAKALVLMGGDYWNNGIHLGVCSTNLAKESWQNINAINDCVEAILTATSLVTFAAIRGNAAAGGFALATCCDFVLCADNAVINPHYRAVGLYGSEYHTLTWYARAGEHNAKALTRGMLPLSAKSACEFGLVDTVLSSDQDLIQDIKSTVIRDLLTEVNQLTKGSPWTRRSYSPGNEHRRVIDSAPLRRHAWLKHLPQPLRSYRNQELDYMKLNFIDPRYERCVQNFTGKAAAASTPFRFCLHRRHAQWEKLSFDPEEELDYFDYTHIDSEAVHSALGILPSRPIYLISPPSLHHQSILLSHSQPEQAALSPTFSEATTLFSSPPFSRENSRSPDRLKPPVASLPEHTGSLKRINSTEVLLSESPRTQNPSNNPPTIVVRVNTFPAIPQFDPSEVPEKTSSSSHLSPFKHDFNSHRISRVAQKLKAAFVVKPGQGQSRAAGKITGEPLSVISPPSSLLAKPSTEQALSNSIPSLSLSSKPKLEHQMRCYYVATDNDDQVA